MPSLCITTVCTADHFQWFIPSFIYSAKRAYPDADVKVFLMGKLKDVVEQCLLKMKAMHVVNTKWEVLEDTFVTIPKLASTANSLRYLLSGKTFQDVDYVYVTDVDFIMFCHKPSHLSYYSRIMDETKMPIAAMRSSIKHFLRSFVKKQCWTGMYTRLVGGLTMLKSPEWFDKTKGICERYFYNLKEEKHDAYDKIKPASYREYDEVMLYRICTIAGIRTPKARNCFVNGEEYDREYRDIHLGDFKFASRGCSYRKMKTRIHDKNVVEYKNMTKELGWSMVYEVACMNPDVKICFSRLNKHVKRRLGI